MKEGHRAKEFLEKYQMNTNKIDFEEQCEIFLSEMEQGLEGKESSLAMLPTYIEADLNIPAGEPIVVLDAGGTNLRVATIYFNKDGQPVMNNFHQYPMPGTHGELSKEEFFYALADCTKHLAHKSRRIGFCFSYPTEMRPDGDGRLIRFTKEVRAKGVEGERIGENLLLALKDRGCKGEKRVILLNDTVAALLAGKGTSRGRLFDGYLGFILGTGTNASYIEENQKIKKISGLNPKKSMIINVEWGGYNKGPQGEMDLIMDRALHDPGFYVFEKMVSGAYLGKLVLTTIKKAGEEKLLTSGFTNELRKVPVLETKDINDFLHYSPSKGNPLSSCLSVGSSEDVSFVCEIIDGIIERAALFTAINLTALMLKMGKGHDSNRPICITVEGTTFFALKGFRNKIESYLKKTSNDHRCLNYEFIRVEHASLIGAAMAGFSDDNLF